MLHVPSSVGDAVDRSTILHIKSSRVEDPVLLKKVIAERDALDMTIDHYLKMPDVQSVYEDLRIINETLWDVEDSLRRLERENDFGDEFIRLARAVYKTNDRRALLKKLINVVTRSELAEVKWHT